MESAHDQTDPRTAWYEALKEENCVQVRRLLRKDTELLEEGWGDLQASNQPRGWNQRTALHVAARRGDAELVEQIREILCSYSKRISMDSKQGRRSSDFLEVIDGDYDLDALAMAVVNGNRTIVNLLKRISLDCTSNPDGIGEKEGEMEAPPSPQLDTTAVNNICDITSKALSARPVDEQKEIHTMYGKDCDFNFLNKYLYLFHFTFSTWHMSRRNFIEPIQEAIFSQAKGDGLLEVLLSELKDGQGRTALHVAVDSHKVKEFRAVIEPKEGEEELHRSFLNVRDSAGRTPLYRAAAKDLQREVDFLLEDHRVDVHAEIKYDAYQWGADLDIDRLSRDNNFKSDCVYVLSKKLEGKGFNNKGNAQAGPGPDIIPVKQVCSTALHVSIIHKNGEIAKKLCSKIEEGLKQGLKQGHKPGIFSSCSRRYTWPIEAAWRDELQPYDIIRRVSTMNLAVLVGDIPTLQHLLLAEDRLQSVKRNYFSQCPPEEPEENKFDKEKDEKSFLLAEKKIGEKRKKEEAKDIPSFLLAAAMGSPGCIKAFLDSEACEPSYKIIDKYENTALHHALKGKQIDFQPHLIDFVGCQHVFRSRRANAEWITWWLANPEETGQEVIDMEKDIDVPTRENAQEQGVLKAARLRDGKKDNDTKFQDNYGQRQGSINLLLQSGIDLWEKNQHDRTCCPEHDAPKDFTTWWYGKVAEETQQVQDKLSAAANAIAITASLVATASYAGPLQPPLGYGGDPLSVQVGLSTVRAFVICDSLSFYFALSALVLALLPSLPLETESMFDELVRTRIVVAFAVTFLFPSIICILLAFTVNYFAVIPDDGLAYHGLIVATTVVGGFFCLIVMSWLVGRLFKVYKPLYKVYKPKGKRILKKLGLLKEKDKETDSSRGRSLPLKLRFS